VMINVVNVPWGVSLVTRAAFDCRVKCVNYICMSFFNKDWDICGFFVPQKYAGTLAAAYSF